MKKILLSLLTLFPFALYAQKLDIGLHAGPTIHGPESWTVPLGMEYKFPIGYTAGVSTMLNLGKWQTGIVIDAISLPTMENYLNYVIDFNRPTVAFRAIGNRKLGGNSRYLYAGLTLGYITANLSMPSLDHYGKPLHYKDNADGTIVGLQAGYVWQLSDHLGVNMEVSPRRYQYWNRVTVPITIYTCPVTAGVRFRM
ncbi:MAG: hypothetical protein JNL72_13975 [Flavipsychrobacter sp.]|nr:hypothetical protein [Flavipsychrobacter sp.]